METEELEYLGFWARVGASLIDTVVIGIIIWPLLTYIYGAGYWSEKSLVKGPMDFLLSWVFPMVAVIFLWVKKQSTPGKMVFSASIVDADTGAAPSTGQFIGRYLAYFVSALPLCLGIFWVAFDKRKQGWHDKLAGTVVVRQKNRKPPAATFHKRR